MKRIVHVISFILLIMLLVACSNNDEELELELEQVKISVERTGNLITGLGKVKVYIDDEEVMQVKNNETETINIVLSPGIHTIQTKGQGDKSGVEEFEVVAGANNVFLFNTEISNIYGVKLELLKADNAKNEVQADSQNEVTAESNTQQPQEEVASTYEENQNEAIQSDLDAIPVQGASNTVESARDQIGYLIYYYLQAYADGDTTSLGYFVHPSSALYSEQENYMKSLNSRGIVLDLIDYELISMEYIADKKYSVTVTEYYTVDNPEKGFGDTKQTSQYTVELIDGEFYITELKL